MTDQLGHDTVKAGDFCIPLSSLKLSKMPSLLNHVIDKLDLTDIHRLLHETTTEPAPKCVT